ncbi:TonB-dependent receptor [Fulvivirga sp. M361]|uniref:TonB-dependent receptor n=1 Tax=Fulvivirga sp. M361 TaxID=2594266 RepID=UPI00117B9E14|nr:TonB-dependent receptor [Fulvivirga sp. M361]TRX51178.1 TonB-dependent receptor [Fulvivirga sp. M361]
MKGNIIFIVLTALIISNLDLHAQKLSTIRGRVLDGDSGEGLMGASVVIGTSTVGTATDYNGEFTLKSTLGGTITIHVSFIGFASKSLEVEVNQSEIVLPNIELNADIASLEAVVVLGSLEGQQRALNQQRTADNIKNIVSADLIGRFPDLNVAEALQRVPGVNIQRDKGEGSTVSIRGTPLNFTTVQINGEQIPSVQQNGARTESLDLIPADQLGSIEITKAPTPDMDGDAIGGTINLKTPVAKSADLGVRAEAGLGYNEISDGYNGIGKLRLDKRFFPSDNTFSEGKLGIIAGGSWYNSDNFQHSIDADWTPRPVELAVSEEEVIVIEEYQYRLRQNERERIGATFTMDYEFNDKNSIIFNYMYNRRQDVDIRNRLRFDMDGARYQTLDSITGSGPNLKVRRDINIFDELKENQTFNLGGSHKLSNWDIDWGAFYTVSKRTLSSDRADFSSEETEVTVIVDNPEGIYAEEPSFRLSTNDPDVHDPFLYSTVRRYEEDFESTDATNLVGRVDVARNFQLYNGSPVLLKFGGKLRTQENDKFRNNQVLIFSDPNDLINENEIFLRTLSGVEPLDFLYSDYRFGPLISQESLQQYVTDNRRLLNTSDLAWDSRRLSLNDTYEAQESIYAGYAMTRVQLNKLMILAGLRYEFNEVSYDAFDVFRFGTSVESSPISGGNDYHFWLPNVHLKYSLTTYTALRFSAVWNYSRPNFVDVVPFVNQDADARILRLGNPELTPANAFNLDVMFEHYFKNVGVISLGAFYKDIDNFQFDNIDPSLLQDFPGFSSTQGFLFSQQQNGENAKVAGFEFNFFNSLRFLPGVLKNFNIEGNYTYAYSDAFTNERENISLPGQAEHTFNTALSFDYKTFTARVSANYNGSFLTSVASVSENDFIQKARLQMDANASLKFKDHWRVFVEGVNITNEPTIRFQGDESRISRISYFGWSVRSGISFSL